MICKYCFKKVNRNTLTPEEKEWIMPYYCPNCDTGFEAIEVASEAHIDENGEITFYYSDELRKEIANEE